MLIEKYELEVFTPPCDPGAERYAAIARLTADISAVLPYRIYLGLIILLLPIEEEGLQRAYGEPYRAYQQKVSKLVPFLY